MAKKKMTKRQLRVFRIKLLKKARRIKKNKR
jgi:hypothetical protein